MSSLNDPVGFELNDVLTRVLPGAVFVFSIAIVVDIFDRYPDDPAIVPFSTTFIAIGIILSFLFGELIELFRHHAYRTPRPFNQLIYRSTSKTQHLYVKDKYRVKIYKILYGKDPSKMGDPQSGFVHGFFYAPWMNDERFYVEREYDQDIIDKLANSNPLPGDDHLPEHLYYHLLKEVNQTLDNEAKRRQTLSIFYTNFKISLVPTLLFLLYIGYVVFDSVQIVGILVAIGILTIGPVYMYLVAIIEISVGDPRQTHISDLLREYVYQIESRD